ncbi:MAG: hypothetical protein DI586_11015, partial [Micavibrio aeruginosavorus]
LQKAGAIISAFDPIAMDHAKKAFTDVNWCEDSVSVAQDAEAVVILTEWNEFRALPFDRIEQIMATPRLIDLRNIYKLPEMKARGFHYVSIGRSEIKPDQSVKLRSVS